MREVVALFTAGIDSEEALAVQAGVRQVLQYVSGEFVVDVVGDPCRAEVWQQRCLEKSQTGQVSVECLLEELLFFLIQHADKRGRVLVDSDLLAVLAVDADLRSSATNFLFGSARPGYASVLSVSRFRTVTPMELRKKVLTRLARHEFGHALGLIPEGRRTNVKRKLGLHCTNLCTMRQGMSLEEFEQLTTEEEKAGVVFCPECVDHLRSVGAGFNPLWGGIR